jgi:glucose-1-phosphatase
MDAHLSLEAVIFDLGGVLLNLDYARTVAEFKALSRGAAAFYGQENQHPIFDHIETGHVTEEEFRATVKSLLGGHSSSEQTVATKATLSDQAIDHAWNAMILDFPPERIQLVSDLRQRFRTFLLSNTNSIHKAAVMEKVEESVGIATYERAFERTYYSHEMGLRKPNPEIFVRVVKENRLNPARTLFIDDSLQHVEGARLAGLQALHLDFRKYETVADLLAYHRII